MWIRRRGVVWSSRISDPLRLQQVSILVPCDDLQTRADREPDDRNERISETHPVHIAAACLSHDRARCLVARQKPIEHRDIHAASWRYFPRRARSLGRRSDVAPNEPRTEPAGRDLIDHGLSASRYRRRDRLAVHFVRDREVLQALSHAPGVRTWPPIELVHRERPGYSNRTLIRCGQLGEQAAAPGRK